MAVGSFVWYDLSALDPQAASRFYRDVVGWTVEDVPEMHYTLLSAGPDRAAGIMSLPQHLRDMGVPPHWTGYIHVADVDAMARRATEHGASLNYGPEDIPSVGRFAAMADPDGAPFYLFTPTGAEQPDPGPMRPGHVGWHELIARDQARAFDFYGALFGWERSRAIDMGPMGTYQLFSYGGMDRGGIMTAPPGMHPHWLFYVVVDGLDAAQARIAEAGGTVIRPPAEVPGGAWVLHGTDPDGARFALVSARR